ncbi:MAG: hypothetical protein CM15mP63_0970 [Gammaproteobacteria bacterium]|nr:MAG: hypothetical protein CM15mP63_0970 [Gammaproteobacteria bacterium]
MILKLCRRWCQIILEQLKNISELEKKEKRFLINSKISEIILLLSLENIIIRRFKVIDNRDVYISLYS